jgi:DNA-binding XRE family transcriptional regulator
MKTTSTLIQNWTTGLKVRRLRISSMLTQRELADLAGIPEEQVEMFERDYPIPLDSRRRIFKELWAIKVKK